MAEEGTMPKITLQFKNRLLKQCVVCATTTIGRLPDNAVVIDSPAVSGHHACVFREGDHFVVEDLASTNGTFVNGKRVTRHALQHGDTMRLGKHTILFETVDGEQFDAQERAEPIMTNPGETIFLEADKYKSLLATLRETETRATAGAPEPAATVNVGVLRVLSGRSDQPEYKLDAYTSVVGKSDNALVRLQGWFKPKEAIAIARSGASYVATGLSGTTFINKQPLSGRRTLEDGDVLEVSGLTLEFRLEAKSA
jgi:pSer/pThr/pTyr-binding forkhead associated (FHA) protein